jgi:acetylornithine/N-succinyldiaminopimelate aminotransferase
MKRVASLMFIAERPNIVFVKGDGSWLYDEAGQAYLDFIQGWAVNSLGHSPRIIRDALAEQAAKVINVSPAYYNEPMCRLADLLTRLSGLARVFFTNSGAEANEGAIKLARKWGEKRRCGAFEIIVFENAFHGRTLATMSASGKPQFRDLYEPKVPGFLRVAVNDLSAVERAIGVNTVGVMLEPIQGEAGIVSFSDSFLRELRKLTAERGLLLILDEVQTGIGRTGRMFCYEHADIQPDILTVGKGIGGGVPLAGMLAREEICIFEAGDQGGTYNGNALMTAVGCAVVEEISRPEFLKRVRENGEYLADELRTISSAFGLGEVRGRGLLLALGLKQPIASDIVTLALDRRLLINAVRPDVLRFMPALSVTRNEIDEMLHILRQSIQRRLKGA